MNKKTFFKYNFYRFILLSLVAGFCGNFANSSYHFLPILIIITLWIFIDSKNRLELTTFITCYHSMSARSLIVGYASFFNSSFLFGILLVILASFCFAIIISFLSFNKNKFIQLLLINILWCVPIFIIGWAAPFFAVGFFMPGLGWIGLIIFIPLVYFLKLLQLKYKLLSLFIIFSLTFIKTNNKLSLITSINTNFNNNLIKDRHNIYKKISATFKKVKKIKKIDIVILPEDGIPCFDNAIKKISIREMKKNSIPLVLSGSTTCYEKNPKSGIILINKNKAKFIYTQRQPMPYAMYIPFTNSYPINWLNNGIIEINGKKYGLFVCFETVLIWTYLQTIFYKPDILLSFNSVYWDNTGRVKIMQDQLMYSIARLFNIKYQGVWNV